MSLSLQTPRKRFITAKFVATTLLLLGSALPAMLAGQQLSNPLVDYADPFITQANGEYLLLASTSNNITLGPNTHLELIGSDPHVVWQPPTDGSAGTGLTQSYSPTLWHMDGSWWIYFTATYQDNGSGHQIFALRSDTEDPLGSYTFQGTLPLDHAAIHPSVLFVGGTTYFMYVAVDQGFNGVYIVPLSDPLTPLGSQNLLIYPDQPWEAGAGTNDNYQVSEGPTALYNGSSTFIVYSGSDTASTVHCLGLLTYSGSGDVTDYHNWSKSGPVFYRSDANGVDGPGRGLFTTSPDGNQN